MFVSTSAATAATFTGLYGAFSRRIAHPGLLAGSAALNSGLAAAVFFSAREYVISPLLLSTMTGKQCDRRRRELETRRLSKSTGEPVPSGREQLSWSDMRSHKMLDTTLSGAFTGGILNAWKRGRAGVLPGITTGTILCGLLQLGYNEFFVQRLKYISRRLRESETTGSQPPVQAPRPTETLLPRDDPGPSEPRQSFSERILGLFGFSKIPDDVFLERLRQERDAYLRRIRRLEAQIEEDKRQKPSEA
ncbi:hypothetical protein GLOTRDRAFT_126778 [Gloeophyllum trabeum ATCC 11539]|uniref:Uncharacterized protein n=1 Tax=Gloeophyllum trabeum (strain ATCC 11539 / FP-39264 / Madison 617) TaxID=670483 RepID=S7QGH6_GLOTA|nr:uncharacterized protein GLOTRDRAFT_126778 [Gloeophyllum trabeum ATCC 11539]EPQ58288.1 hypothetical protein GLOTRDRAFT_126778 [Gloeophyllum trabeum ATCC 11539]